MLRRWLQFKDRYNTSDYVFPSNKSSGTHIEVHGFETNFTKYLQRFGIPEKVSPHCLRNNFAKRCLLNGMDIYTLSKILGHSSVTVTEEAYLDLTDEDFCARYQNFSPMTKVNWHKLIIAFQQQSNNFLTGFEQFESEFSIAFAAGGLQIQKQTNPPKVFLPSKYIRGKPLGAGGQ